MTPRKLDEFNYDLYHYRVVLNAQGSPVVEKQGLPDAMGVSIWISVGGAERIEIIAMAALRVAAGVASDDGPTAQGDGPYR